MNLWTLRLASIVGIILGVVGIFGLFVWERSYACLSMEGQPFPGPKCPFDPQPYELEFLIALVALIIISCIGLYYSFVRSKTTTRNETPVQTTR